MKRTENTSPFRQLLKIIENEAYDFDLECKSHNLEELNVNFCNGYRTAINTILERALAIYNRGLRGRHLVLDFTKPETTATLIEQFKKER